MRRLTIGIDTESDMMAGSIKLKANLKGDTTEVKMLIEHPMESGTRKDDAGELIPAHYIQQVTCELNGKVIARTRWGPSVSKNPYWAFKFKGGQKGDKLKVTWVDNKGETDSTEAEIQ